MALIRMLALGAMGLVLAALGGNVFDTVVWELLLVPVIVTVAAVLTRELARPIAVGAVLAAVVVATVLATIASGGSMTDAVPGARQGPRRLLSTEWPSPLDPTMVATLAVLIGLGTGIAQLMARRERRRLLPLLPITLVAIAMIGLAAPAPPPTWTLVALGALAIGTVLSGGSRAADHGLRALVPDRTVLATIVVVGVSGAGVAGAVAWAERADPRDTEDAELTATLLDPIESTVAMRRAEPIVTLATITDRSLLARPTMPARWRIAAFDDYDGQRWTPEVDLRPIGGRLAEIPPGSDAASLAYQVRFHGDQLDLVPFPGQAIEVDEDVETDLDRVVVRLIDEPDAATVVNVLAIPSPAVADVVASNPAVTPRQVDDIAANFDDRADRLAGDGTEIERLGRLAQTMRSDWELDSGAPGAGQQLALIERFVVETQRGTREQFVTGYALLARALGYDTRVAAGFIVPPAELGASFDLRTEHAAIWPEVRLADGRWLAFDPVPARETSDDEPPPPRPETQSPAAAQPPSAPPAEDADQDDTTTLDTADAEAGWGTLRTWVVRVGTVGGIVLTPIVLVIGLVLALKWRRRRTRLLAADPATRVRGIWANTTDSLVDAGLTIAPSWTDDRIAAGASSVVAGVPHETRRLAAMSATVTFGSRSRDEAARLADDAVTTAALIDGAIRASRTRWERLRWRLSLRSFRRATRSPVVP